MTEIRYTAEETFYREHGYWFERPLPPVLPPDPVEGVYGYVRDRCIELDRELPEWAESLRLAELDAEAWLVEHGYPAGEEYPEEWEWDDPVDRT